MAVPVVYWGFVWRYLWKFGASTARIQYHPDCNVVPGPLPEGALPPGRVVEGPLGVVLVGVVVVLKVVVGAGAAAPGWHCE